MLKLSSTIPQRIESLVTGIRGAQPAAAETIGDCLAWYDVLESHMVDSWACLMAGAGIASASFDATAKLIDKVSRGAGPDLTNRLHVGLGGNESADTGRAVRSLALLARGDRQLLKALVGGNLHDVEAADPEFAVRLGVVITRFGHRATPELEIAETSWRQDPAPLMAAIARQAERAGTEENTDAIAVAAEAELRRTTPRPLQPLLAVMLRRSRAQMSFRENAKTPIVVLFDEIRKLLERSAPLLAEIGVLDHPADAVMLRATELRDVLAGGPGPGSEELTRRRAEHARCAASTVPELVMADAKGIYALADSEIAARGLLPHRPAAMTATHLSGVAASPGRITGRARILLDPDDDFDAGDILFATTVDPGWSAILACAGAVVLDIGGVLSHGAVVARELGVPCVVNVKDGTRVVSDGATVTVDGSSGMVTL